MSVHRSLSIVVLAVVSTAGLATTGIAIGGPAPPADAAARVLQPPVEAPVTDPFRLPDGPYGAGNRGIEYGTSAGVTVDAAGDGIVVFVGPVAGALHVTIDHGGGLRTSYSFVASIRVRPGQVVAAGDPVAITGGRFHFGARIDGRYVDPAELFGVRQVRVALVAHDDPRVLDQWLDLQARSERLALAELRGGGGWSLGGFAGAVWDAVDEFGGLDDLAREELRVALADLTHLAELSRTALTEVSPATLVTVSVEVAATIVDPPECTPDSAVVTRPTGRRIAVVLDGLGSSSEGGESMAQLDLESQGYTADDTVRFSYAGGLVDDGAEPAWARDITRTHYGPTDTHQDIEITIARLEATLVAVAEANPRVPIDVYGHSLGGLVARHAVAAVGGDGGSVDVGVAVTIASPHAGAPLAELLESTTASRGGRSIDAGLDLIVPGLPLGTPIAADLSVSGFAGDHADVAFPAGVHAVALADRGDLVVPASTASAPGAHTRVLGGAPSPTAHSDLPGHPGVQREISLALAGRPPSCEGVVDRIADIVQPRAIEWVEHQGAAAILVGGVSRTGP